MEWLGQLCICVVECGAWVANSMELMKVEPRYCFGRGLIGVDYTSSTLRAMKLGAQAGNKLLCTVDRSYWDEFRHWFGVDKELGMAKVIGMDFTRDSTDRNCNYFRGK